MLNLLQQLLLGDTNQQSCLLILEEAAVFISVTEIECDESVSSWEKNGQQTIEGKQASGKTGGDRMFILLRP